MAETAKLTPMRLVEMLFEKGISTVLAGVLLYGFWAIVLQPMAKERVILIGTLQENSAQNRENAKSNRESQESSAESNRKIAHSVQEQADTLISIREEVAGQSALRKVAMRTMTAFAEEMGRVNPANSLKLDELLKLAAESTDTIKLDILIKSMEELKAHAEETNPKPGE